MYEGAVRLKSSSGFEEESDFDFELNQMGQEAASSWLDDHVSQSGPYLEPHDPVRFDAAFCFSSYDSVNPERDGNRHLPEDWLPPRKRYARQQQQRVRYQSPDRSQGSTHCYDDFTGRQGDDENGQSNMDPLDKLCQSVDKNLSSQIGREHASYATPSNPRNKRCVPNSPEADSANRNRHTGLTWRQEDDTYSDKRRKFDTIPVSRNSSHRQTGDIICKYFARGYCYNRGHCRFSHDSHLIRSDTQHSSEWKVRRDYETINEDGALCEGSDNVHEPTTEIARRGTKEPEVCDGPHDIFGRDDSSCRPFFRDREWEDNRSSNKERENLHPFSVKERRSLDKVDYKPEDDKDIGWRPWGEKHKSTRLMHDLSNKDSTHAEKQATGFDISRDLNGSSEQKFWSRTIDEHEFHESSDADPDIYSRQKERVGLISRRHSLRGKVHGESSQRNARSSSIFKHRRREEEAAVDLAEEHLPNKGKKKKLCVQFARGSCKRGHHCWFSHASVSSKTHVNENKTKRSCKYRPSSATLGSPTMENFLCDTCIESHSAKIMNRTIRKVHGKTNGNVGCGPKRSHEHSNSATGYTETVAGNTSIFEPIMEDESAKKEKMLSCNQIGDGVADQKKLTDISRGEKSGPLPEMQKKHIKRKRKSYGYKKGEGNDGQTESVSAVCKLGHSDKNTTPDQQITAGEKLVADQCPVIRRDPVPEMPSEDYTVHVKVEVTEERSKVRCGLNPLHSPLAALEQCVGQMGEKIATTASSYLQKESCSPLCNTAALLVVENSEKDTDYVPQFCYDEAQKDSLDFKQSISEKLVKILLEAQVELRESGALEEAQEDGGTNVVKEPFLFQKDMSDTTEVGSKKIVGENSVLGTDMRRNFVADEIQICGNQIREDSNNKDIKTEVSKFEVNVSAATTMFADHLVREEMLAGDTASFVSTTGTTTALKYQEPGELSNDYTGLDSSIDQYIYESLSLEHYISKMENESAKCSYVPKESSPSLENKNVALASENPIQQDKWSPVRTTGYVSNEAKPILSFGNCVESLRIISEYSVEPPLERQIELHGASLQRLKKRPSMELEANNNQIAGVTDTSFYAHKKFSSARNNRNRVPAVETVGQTSETNPISSLCSLGSSSNSGKRTSEESVAIPTKLRSEQHVSSVSKREGEAELKLKVKEPAVLQSNDKFGARPLVSSDSCDMDDRREEGNQNEDGKMLLKIAVRKLAKEILNPLWSAGRIVSKDIFRTILQKVENKVSAAVQGANIPRTQEKVDQYLISNKPKIAQLVLGYVNMYPVRV